MQKRVAGNVADVPVLDDSHVVWRAVPIDVLVWREWDSESVVFNQRTGNTHLLNESAGEILRRLLDSDGGATVESLVADLIDEPNGPDHARWIGAIGAVLSDFARLGLAQSDKS